MEKHIFFQDTFEYYTYNMYYFFNRTEMLLPDIIKAPFVTTYRIIRLVAYFYIHKKADKDFSASVYILESLYDTALHNFICGRKISAKLHLFIYLLLNKSLKDYDSLMEIFRLEKSIRIEEIKQETLLDPSIIIKALYTPEYFKLQKFFGTYRIIKRMGVYKYFIKMYQFYYNEFYKMIQ